MRRILFVVFFILFNITVFKVYWIPSDSMEPVLQKNDYVYVYQLPYLLGYGEPAYGELLVFSYPEDPRYDFIKRVVGKPGDTIAIKNQRLYRNDQYINEYYIPDDMEFPDFELVIVPDNSYFFLGDKREESIDSRDFGAVAIEHIKGVAKFIVWPSERAGALR